ncbi:MAG: sulfide/dihydroorotate dehydrogenase-like FAD/NAD-binding protein [Planctomycetaceae bacterium]|nr:sulfide/dihydroorotate dehydrogenase-like FAD/NAD-binding protein [Planctomycetaceae bacterium]
MKDELAPVDNTQMIPILKNEEIAPNIYEMVVEHPRLVKKVKPGHFVIVMSEDDGERIPLTAADFDTEAGTLTLVIMAVGTSTKKLVQKKKGDTLFALMGPLGHPSEIENFGTALMVAGGVGAAPIYPIAQALKNFGNRVVTIHGARNKDLLFWQDKMAAVSDEYIITTDDGSAGRKALVTEPLRELLETRENEIGCVYMIGPAIMMKFCAQTVMPFNVKGIASLNSIMIDGTGMCGGCRVPIGNETKFTCVDGPEFDAKAVQWDVLLARQKMYCNEEQCSYRQYLKSIGSEV